MIHSYDVDVALALGGVSEAVVLKEIAYWCERNKEKGVNEHDGRHWTYGSVQEIQERFPEFKVKPVLQRLRDGGWLLTGAFNDNPYNHKLWYALSDKSMSLLGQIDLSETENRMSENGQSKKSGNTSGKTIEEIQKKNAEVIDHLYALYPGKTETREGTRSTGKCSKDKVRIASLLRDHTPEQIERSILRYVEEQDGRFLKNFSTFLNNLPEYEDDTVLPLSTGKQITGQDWK